MSPKSKPSDSNEGWTTVPTMDGVWTVHLKSWQYFYQFVDKWFLDHRQYIFRGQRSEKWKLESTLDRVAKRQPDLKKESHLANFKRAALGRRGQNPPKLTDDDDWWALGQHYGLATPLLDWTTSPFVAAFFAFVEEDDLDDLSNRRAVWAVSRFALSRKKKELMRGQTDKKHLTWVEIVQPTLDENARLINQNGLFLKLPDGKDLESWIRHEFDGDTRLRLIKLTIPTTDREVCLRHLNTRFPHS